MARLTARGALVGMVVGLVSSAGVMAAGLVAGLEPGIPALLLAQPALWSVPLAFATMIAVSLRGSPPSGAASAMLRLHLDETARGARRPTGAGTPADGLRAPAWSARRAGVVTARRGWFGAIR